MVACAPEQSAFELDLPDLGRHGALTARLTQFLRESDGRPVTWQQLMNVVRPGVMDLVPQQRPELEGPDGRVLFSTETRATTAVLPVLVEDGEIYLAAPALFGIGVGDRYALVEPGGDPAAPLDIAVVDRVATDRAHLALSRHAVTVAPGTEAHPRETALSRRPVTVLPIDHPERARVTEALRASPHVRVVDNRADGILAGVELQDDGALLLDALGEPLHDTPRPLPGSGGIALLSADLLQLARAAHVRDLESGTGEAELQDGVSVEFVLLGPGVETPLPPSGAHLFEGDRVILRIRNESGSRRYVSIFDIGLRGRIALLTAAFPAGVGLDDGESYEATTPGGEPNPIVLFWPAGLPRGGPRPELLLLIVADRPQDLTALTQEGVQAVGMRGTGRPSALQVLLDEVVTGTRDGTQQFDPPEVVAYRVERLDFLMHPTGRPTPEGTEFEIDERPDASLRLIVPRTPIMLPRRVSVRLVEVIVHSNRAMLSSTVRIDALVVTRTQQHGGVPYHAATARFDRIQDGDRLPLDNLLVYNGPVEAFLDLAVWVARDDKEGVELAELLQGEAASSDVQGAIAALAGVAIAAPQAALAAGAVVAVATLVRTGARLLDAATGKSIGVYRTSLLPHERLGAGSPARRHPSNGLLRAQDVSFAYEIVETE